MPKEELLDIIINLINDDYSNNENHGFENLITDVKNITVKETTVSLLNEPIYHNMLYIPVEYNSFLYGRGTDFTRMVFEQTLNFVSQVLINYDSDYYDNIFSDALKHTIDIYLSVEDKIKIDQELPDLYRDIDVWFRDEFLPNLKLSISDLIHSNDNNPIYLIELVINFIEKQINITYGTRLE